MGHTVVNEAQRMASHYAQDLAEDLETWGPSPEAFETFREFEDRLTLLNALLKAVVLLESRRRSALGHGHMADGPEAAVRSARTFRRLSRVCLRVERSIRFFESHSYGVEGASLFRSIYQVLKKLGREPNRPPQPRPVRVGPDGRLSEMSGEAIGVPGLEPESVLRGIADLEANRTFPISEIRSTRRP